MFCSVFAGEESSTCLATLQVEIYLTFVGFALYRLDDLGFNSADNLYVFLTVYQSAGAEGFGDGP